MGHVGIIMKMSEQEYKELQDNLSKKISDDNLSRVTIGWNTLLGWREREAYKAGILAAKSIVASFYTQQNEDKEN